jgi:hypothetical protein
MRKLALQNMSPLSRRLALLGAGAAAGLFSSEAKTDVPFTSYAFTGLNQPTPRTMPQRIADIVNVKDFGAKGDGSTDDTLAIQAAIDAAMTLGVQHSSSIYGATVFFPPGRYIVSAPLTDTAVTRRGADVNLVGSGCYCTTIDGGRLDGFVIDKEDRGIFKTINSIQHLFIKNSNTAAGTGAVRLNYSYKALLADCIFHGFIGVDMSSNIFDNCIINCWFEGLANNPPLAGSFGICLQQGGIYGGKIQAFENGIRIGGGYTTAGTYRPSGAVGITIQNVAIEVCSTAVVLGRDAQSPANTTGAAGIGIYGLQTEQCQTSINVLYGTGINIGACVLTGTIWTDGSYLTTGITIGTATGVAINGVTISQSVTNARVDLSAANARNVVFNGVFTGAQAVISGGGVAWKMPATGYGKNPCNFAFVNCDNPAYLVPFGNLRNQFNSIVVANSPQPVEGDQYDINDLASTTATPTIGATAVSMTGYTWARLGAGKAIPVGLVIFNNANNTVFIVTIAGTTGTGEPTWNTTPGATTTDGTVTWTCLNPKSAYTYTGLHARVRFNGSAWTVIAY